MSARDDLAREIFIADNAGQSREASLADWAAYDMATAQSYAHNIADGLIAAGYGKLPEPAPAPQPETFAGPGYEAHPGHDHEDCCK